MEQMKDLENQMYIKHIKPSKCKNQSQKQLLMTNSSNLNPLNFNNQQNHLNIENKN